MDEAILLDQIGNVSEAPGENIFIVKDGDLATPSISSSALDGITRNSIIKLADDMDIEVVERSIAKSELSTADEIFLTGTAAEITPIIELDSKKNWKWKAWDYYEKNNGKIHRNCFE